MILGDYNGAIFSKALGSQFGTTIGFPKTNEGIYTGAISEQNIPNIINIFGYMEDHCDIYGNKPFGSTTVHNYGNSRRNDQGIPVYDKWNGTGVLYALADLLNAETPISSNKRKILRYSPYGCIVARAPKFKSTANDVFTTATNPVVYSFGLIKPQFYANYQGLNINLIPYNVDFVSIINNGIIPPDYRISDNKTDLLQFFTNLAENTGQSIFITMEFNIGDGDNIYPYIKVNTISKLSNSADNIVQNFIDDIASKGISVTSYTKGEEYNNNEPVRTMLIGGKQQRLYQVCNLKYALKQSTLRYNSYVNRFMTVDHFTDIANSTQYYRFYDTANIRNPDHYTNQYPSPATPFGRVEFYSANFNRTENIFGGYSQKLGNYQSTFKFLPIDLTLNNMVESGGKEYPSYINDAICPYFGNDQLTGYIRPVTHHHKHPVFSNGVDGGGVGYLVYFSLEEISAAIGVSYSGTSIPIRISETEIRAAMSGFDSYIGFLTGLLEDGRALDSFNSVKKGIFPVDIWKYVLGPIITPVNIAALVAYDSFSSPILKGMVDGISRDFNFNAATGVPGKNGNNNVAMAPRSSVMTDPKLYDVLTKLHQFFKNVGDEYYGKKFMINVPSPQIWTDVQQHRDALGNNVEIQIGEDDFSNPIYLLAGSKQTYYSFEPADFAWEEPGNYIDDSLKVGNSNMDPFIKDDGSIGPILGFNNTLQYNYSKELYSKIYELSQDINPNSQLIHLWKWDISRMYGIGYANNENLWEPALSVKDSDNVTIRQTGKSLSDPFGTVVPGQYISKVYCKAEVKKEFETYSLNNKIYPKIIMSLSQPMFINPITPESLSVQTAIAEYFINDYTGIGNTTAIRALANSMFVQQTAAQVQAGPSTYPALSQPTANKQFNNLSISPKAAIPFFAAVPIVDNVAVYGPWVSAPDLLKNTIFPFDNAALQTKKIENMIGGVKLEINNDLVPWNYGGMRILDEIALLTVGQDNDYQQKSETGQITIHGVPFLKIGDELKAAGYAFRGPTVSNIQCQITENGPSTTYTFRTFTKKFTLYNKDNADRIKKASESTQKLNKEFRQSFNRISAILNTLASSPVVQGSSSSSVDSILRSYSPVNILVGYSSPQMSKKFEADVSMGFYPNINSSHDQWTGNSIKQITTVGLQESREVVQEFESLYSSKSFMSMDGLLHPVSFYPTLLSSTTPYKKYFTNTEGDFSGCPICRGTKVYVIESKTLYCDFCSDVKAGEEESSESSIGRLPPFILSDQADSTIIKNPNALKELLQSTVKSRKIDYVNLNPIIMPVGELRNKFAQSSDYTAHHIDVVGRSVVPPLGSLSISANLNIDQNGLEYYDQNKPLSDGDWNSAYFDSATNRIGISDTTVNIGGKNVEYFQNNHRFLALRGPLVLAGWGFDVDGFPVPNASGEPQSLDDNGYPKRIQNKQDQDGGFQNYPGTILGKNQTWDSEKGEWSAPVKETEFYKGWGLRPDTWPVGPVDLRWDENRKVWTAPQPYSLVDVQLEDDLVPPFPARAFLNGVDKTSPLPDNLRRMIFVRDSTESYGAPRGAKLTCYYDEGSGFYEPISKQNIVALGTIDSNGTAKIKNAYSKGFDPITGDPEEPEIITIMFNNYLNFDISSANQPGIFTFLKNEWVLTSSNACGG